MFNTFTNGSIHFSVLLLTYHLQNNYFLSEIILSNLLTLFGGFQAIFFKKLAILGVAFLAVGGLFNFINPNYHFGDYYHLGPGGCILLVGINLLFLWGTNYFVTFIKDSNTIFRFLSFCSKNVTAMYVIQWTLINWGMYVFGFWKHNALTVLLLIPMMITLTVLVLKGWLLFKKKIKPQPVLVAS